MTPEMNPDAAAWLERELAAVSGLHPAFDPDVWNREEVVVDVSQQIACLADQITELKSVIAEQARLLALVLSMWTEGESDDLA